MRNVPGIVLTAAARRELRRLASFWKNLLAALLCLSVTPAFAQGRLQVQYVAAIKVLDDGSIVGQFVNQHEDPDGCAGTRKQFYIPAMHSARKEMLALLTAALHTGTRITVFVSGCTTNSNPNDVFPIVFTMDAII